MCKITNLTCLHEYENITAVLPMQRVFLLSDVHELSLLSWGLKELTVDRNDI